MIRVSRPRVMSANGPDGPVESRASIDVGPMRDELIYRVARGPATRNSSMLLAATLLPAMRVGETLRLDGPVSPELIGSVPAIQSIFRSWFSDTTSIEVEAESAPEPQADGVACFFSGGVDSFYSVLTHIDEITALVFVHGFDIQPRHVQLRTQISTSLRAAAAALGKPLIEVETNVRAFADRYTAWSEEYHGSALASVALMLSPQFRRFYIPASFPPRYTAPWGSHKDLDPLWSTESTAIYHDGAGASRVEKARLISESAVAMRYLRVCWENRGGNYNCGRCEKCVRTMVNLRVVGGLERCSTFPRSLHLVDVTRSPIPDECSRVFVEDNLEAATMSGDQPLARALAAALVRKQGGLADRIRKGDLRERAARRLDRALGRPVYDWALPAGSWTILR